MSRYIDADRFKDTLEGASEKMHLICGVKGVDIGAVIKAVDMFPTTDVVEVKHGEWIDKPTGAYSRMQSWCSACGKHSGIGGIESNRHKPYCPNCGAKMDGERREG